MFEKLDMAPPDAILGLKEAYNRDTHPTKLNLSVGEYQDPQGNTPVFQSVKRAEERILAAERSKGYLAINGSPQYAAAVQGLVFGADNPTVQEGRVTTAHTPGGTGGLRVAADFIKAKCPGATVWLCDPTWPNHPNIFKSAGVPTQSYPYYNSEAKALDFERMAGALKQVPAGDFVLLHGCCHNPTGMDPTPEQWQAIADIAKGAGWIPFFDFAYQGLGDGLDEDAIGVRTALRAVSECLVVSSFSKNFGLYNERVGALSLVASSAEAAGCALSHIKQCVRTMYSNPPAHGSNIVTTILNDPALRAEWDAEVAVMRARINGMRRLFVDTLKAKGVTRDFSFLTRQRGMFSFSGLTKDQVQALRENYGIYIVVAGGRINVAAMTEANMDGLCTALASVL